MPTVLLRPAQVGLGTKPPRTQAPSGSTVGRGGWPVVDPDLCRSHQHCSEHTPTPFQRRTMTCPYPWIAGMSSRPKPQLSGRSQVPRPKPLLWELVGLGFIPISVAMRPLTGCLVFNEQLLYARCWAGILEVSHLLSLVLCLEHIT